MKYRLDLQFFAGEKTEKATPKKQQDTRKKGQVAKSQDVNTAILLLFSLGLLALMGGYFKVQFLQLFTHVFNNYLTEDITANTVQTLLVEMSISLAKIVGPVMGIAILAGLVSNFAQFGLLFSGEAIKFDLKKIDPIQGAKRIFSVRALVELLKSLLKIGLVGAVTFYVLWQNMDTVMTMFMKSPENAMQFFGKITLYMGFAATLALLFIAVLDYAYQRFDFAKNIRMSKQDIKDEYKNMEGNPLIRSKIKEKQRQMSMMRMMSEVPKADVVITNPTHFAIAIKYDDTKSDTPIVIAKGMDHVALKIKEIAKANDVTMVENRPLARGLYKNVELNHPIQEEFFQAVAEVLAFVYRTERKT
ncbi:flagellar biosynthesis protein FlhB [Terribacillus saccharophilus]|uniref:Flagellar biosynthetic protein FlhB n=1 Tax=Terribacillus saccharophilus TaxID=361277 RepID=A0A268HCT4_9BACI|nr:flagellar biosynthesis protein FlhB [Terribacillus saccharophilus]PAE07697.1 flagellar biosynthesis protein FlhB [Terribacillus saccharophilus]